MRNQMLAALLGIEELDEMDDKALRSMMRGGGTFVVIGIAIDGLVSIILGFAMHGVHAVVWGIALSVGGYFVVIGIITHFMGRAWLHKRGIDPQTVELVHPLRIIWKNIKVVKTQQSNTGGVSKTQPGPFRYLYARRMLRLYILVTFSGITLIIAGLALLTAPNAYHYHAEIVFMLSSGAAALVFGIWRTLRAKHIIERYTLNEEKRNMSNGMNESTPDTGSTVDGK